MVTIRSIKIFIIIHIFLSSKFQSKVPHTYLGEWVTYTKTKYFHQNISQSLIGI